MSQTKNRGVLKRKYYRNYILPMVVYSVEEKLSDLLTDDVELGIKDRAMCGLADELEQHDEGHDLDPQYAKAMIDLAMDKVTNFLCNGLLSVMRKQRRKKKKS